MSKSGDDGMRLFGRSRTIQDVLLNVSRVRLDLSHAHLRDIIAIEALDRIMHTFRRNGIDVSGCDRASATTIEQYATHDKAGAQPEAAAH